MHKTNRVFLGELEPIKISFTRFADAWSSVILLAAIGLMGCLFIAAMLRGIANG